MAMLIISLWVARKEPCTLVNKFLNLIKRPRTCLWKLSRLSSLLACRHGTKAGVLETYEGHQGPVTGISAHAVQGGIDFSHLFLTSSIDWTIKLWSLKESKPLYSFEHNGDYVYDVAWSPTHPALFAAVDDSGRLDLWNLNQDTEVPTASIVINGCPALNRVSWTPSGLHVTVGDDSGKIWVYDVAEVRSNV